MYLHRHARPVHVRTPQRNQIMVVIIAPAPGAWHLSERPVRFGLLINPKLHQRAQTLARGVRPSSGRAALSVPQLLTPGFKLGPNLAYQGAGVANHRHQAQALQELTPPKWS
ncbi:hypothetical protein [Streptomyces clavifer]|uniref:hypothetical protein n=1 Tax=Streptomyces clavifer TaxID=68188 RepID=UPI00380A127B